MDLFVPSPFAAPFTLPLSPAEFKRAIANGLGRAWLHTASYGVKGTEDILQDALLWCNVFDRQCESERGLWVLSILDQANDADAARLHVKLMERVHRPVSGDFATCHLHHRCAILAELAKRRIPGSRDALFRLFYDSRETHAKDCIGASEIIDVCGSDGLIHICSVIGSQAHFIPDEWVGDMILKLFDETREPGAAMSVLQAAQRHDEGVDRFLCCYKEWTVEFAQDSGSLDIEQAAFRDDFTPPIPRELSADEVICWIRNTPKPDSELESVTDGEWLTAWAWEAGESARLQIFDLLLATACDVEVCRCLQVFRQRPMPALPDEVVALAEHSSELVRARAYEALCHVSDPRIRAVGLRSLTPEHILNGSLDLLWCNYQMGDCQAVIDSLFVPDKKDDLHTITFALTGLCQKNRYAECLPVMLFVYEHSPCGLCRSGVVEVMVELDIAPQWLIAEAQFDSSRDVRDCLNGPACN